MSGVSTKGAHDGSKLVGGDGAITVLNEKGEKFMEHFNVFFSK